MLVEKEMAILTDEDIKNMKNASIDFEIPDWFYLKQEKFVQVSSASSAFDPSVGAWTVSVAEKRSDNKKKILISDWTISYDDENGVDNLHNFPFFVKKLLRDGFEIYFVRDGELKKVTSDSINISDFLHITKVHNRTLTEKMSEQYKVPADELLIVDPHVMAELNTVNPNLRSYMFGLCLGSYNKLRDIDNDHKKADIFINVCDAEINLENFFKSAAELRTVRLHECSNLNEMLGVALDRFSQILKLKIENSKTSEFLFDFLRKTKALRALNLKGVKLHSHSFSPDYFRVAENQLIELRNIILDKVSIDQNLFEHLLKAAPKLKIISISNSDTHEVSLEQDSFPNLVKIIFSRSNVSENCIRMFLKAAPNLLEIKLDNCFSLHSSFIRKIENEFPNIEISYTPSAMPVVPSPVVPSPVVPSPVEQPKRILTSDGFIQTLDTDTKLSDESLTVSSGSIVPITKGAQRFRNARQFVYNVTPGVGNQPIVRSNVQPDEFTEITNITPKTFGNQDDWSQETGFGSGKELDLFEVTQTAINGKCKIMSLTPNDKLIGLKIQFHSVGSPEPKVKIKRCLDDCFYYVSADKDFTFTMKALIGVEENKVKHEIENEKLSKMVLHFQSFPEPKAGEVMKNDEALSGISDASSGVDVLEAMYDQKKGACRHRVGAFLYQFEKLKNFSPGEFSNIKARGVEGGVHTWIELSEDGGTSWQVHDLGGHPADIKVREINSNIVSEQDKPSVEAEKAVEAEAAAAAEAAAEKVETEKVETEKVATEKAAAAAAAEKVAAEKFTVPIFIAIKNPTPFKNINEFLERVFSGSENRMLITIENDECVKKLRTLLMLYTKEKSRETFALDHFSDFVTSKPAVFVDKSTNEWMLKASPAGPLVQFIEEDKKEFEEGKVLLVDWTRLSASEMVRVNSVVDDKERYVGEVLLPKNTKVIGFLSIKHNPGEANLLDDPSFTSRHDAIIKFPFEKKTLDEAIVNLKASLQLRKKGIEHSEKTNEKYVIDLYNSPNWKNLLIGSCSIRGAQHYWDKGPLILALEQGFPIEIKNGPWDDYRFARFMEDLELTGELSYYGCTLRVAQPVVITQSSGYDFTRFKEIITSFKKNVCSNTVSENSYAVNGSTLERCFLNESVVNGVLQRSVGWIGIAADKGNHLALFVTNDLSVEQWYFLLNAAENKSVKLILNIAPNVKLPDEVLNIVKHFAEHSSQQTVVQDSHVSYIPDVKVIISNDLQGYEKLHMKKLTEKISCLVVDGSELLDDDVLYGNTFVEEGNNFKFSEKVSEIWATLQNPNATVVVKGELSENLLNHLSSLFMNPGYLWHQGAKQYFQGKLILLVDKDRPYFGFIGETQREKPDINQDNKRGFYPENDIGQYFSDFDDNKTDLYNKPCSKIDQAIAYAKKHQEKFKSPVNIEDALKGIYIAEILPEEKPLDLSLAACEAFEQSRKDSVDFMLSWSPFVFIESPAGMGKSSFIKEYAKNLFFEKDIGKWAEKEEKELSEGYRILFVDEANLRDTDWTQFSELLDASPTIFINGKSFTLTENHKVVFSGNPLSYGAGRFEQSLFTTHASVIHFPPMSSAYIYQKILLPILRKAYSEEDSEMVSRNIFRKYEELQEPEKSEITARDLQFDALKYCSLKHNSGKIIAKSASHKVSSYLVTESRRDANSLLSDLFRTRAFRFSVKETDSPNAVLYGGKTAFLLDGPPGVGKSDFIKHMLANHGIPEKDCIKIPAGMNEKLKLKKLKHAFKNGLNSGFHFCFKEPK